MNVAYPKLSNILTSWFIIFIVNHATTLCYHYFQILQAMNDLRLQGEYCDIVLKVDDTEFPCHKCVLVASTPYFKVSIYIKATLHISYAGPHHVAILPNNIFLIISKTMSSYEKCQRTLFAFHKILYENVHTIFMSNRLLGLVKVKTQLGNVVTRGDSPRVSIKQKFKWIIECWDVK